MRKLKIILFILFAILTNKVISQNLDGICSDASILGFPIENSIINYEEYKPVIQFKEKYSSFNEVTNKTPEELLKSQMSVTNNEWLAYNFENKIEWQKRQFERIKNQDVNKNYLELTRKITYKFQNTEYAILRVNVFDERRQKPIVVSLKAKYVNERWVLIKEKSKSQIEFLMMNLNIDALDAVFKNSISSNSVLNTIIQDSWDGNVLKLVKAYSILGKHMLENDESISDVFERNNGSPLNFDNQIYEPNFSSKVATIKTNYTIPLINQSFCKYFKNQLSDFDFKGNRIKDFISLIENQNIDNEGEKQRVLPLCSFKYSINSTEFNFIKYILNNENQTNTETKVFVINNNDIHEYTTFDMNNSVILEVIKVLKSDAIIQFSNGENNPEYPEINKLKPLVKDANGILNIEKLAEVINKNKEDLSKYLEN